MPNIIAVTGATGFIGRNLCQHMLAAGFRIRALARNLSAAQKVLQHDACEWVQGELHNDASLEKLLSDAAAVIHLAGSVRGATQQQFDKVNVQGVRRLLQALEKSATPARLLLMSSIVAREPQLSFYAASKRGGEQVLQQEANGVSWTVLRPPAIYGPGDKELMPLFRMAARGFLPLAGAADARFSLLFVDDLSKAVLAWLREVPPAKAIYDLDDGTQGGYDWHMLAAAIAQLRGRQVRLTPVPAWLLDMVAVVNSMSSRLLGHAPMFTPEKLRELRHPDWVSAGAGLQDVLDWRPAVTLTEGLRQTPGWS